MGWARFDKRGGGGGDLELYSCIFQSFDSCSIIGKFFMRFFTLFFPEHSSLLFYWEKLSLR